MFEIRLVPRNGEAIDPDGLVAAVRAIEHAAASADPSRFIYRNGDTGVAFNILLAPEFARHAELALAEEREDGEGPAENAEETVEESGTETAREGEEIPSGEEDEEPDGDAAEETEDEEEESFDVTQAPVTVVVPVLCPAFFALEGFAAAERLAAACGLGLEIPPEEGAAGTGVAAAPPTAAEALAAWRRACRAAFIELPEGTELDVWPAAKAEAWWRYGNHRRALAAELERHGIHVPVLFAARHAGEVKTLSIWEQGTPAVFPRTDLVLIRRKRPRKGLLWTRHVSEEGLVDGGRLWDLLRPGSELRAEPLELLVFHSAAAPPSGVAADLEVLRLEPTDSARRTELLGVLDDEVALGAGEEGPAWKGAS
jgi:hypothetical protein